MEERESGENVRILLDEYVRLLEQEAASERIRASIARRLYEALPGEKKLARAGRLYLVRRRGETFFLQDLSAGKRAIDLG
jgi:hypothetical protein